MSTFATNSAERTGPRRGRSAWRARLETSGLDWGHRAGSGVLCGFQRAFVANKDFEGS